MPTLRSLRRHYRPLYGALTLGTVVTLITLIFIQSLPFFTSAELSAYDSYFQRRSSQPLPNNIAVVGVDNTSIQDLAGGRTPIPRHWVANAINFLHRAHVRAIGIDFTFDGPSIYGAADDRALARAIKSAGNVVLVQKLEGTAASTFVSSQISLVPPIPSLARNAAGLGVANIPQDQDGAVRASDLLQAGPGNAPGQLHMYPAFPAVLASVALGKPASQVIKGLPTHLLLNYNGAQNPGDASQQSFHSYQFEALAKPPLDSTAPFRNKIVLIVPDAVTYKDLFTTPYGQMYGGYVQANVLNTILNRNPITPAGNGLNNLVILVIGLLTTVVAARFGIYRSAAYTLAIGVGYAVVVNVLFVLSRIWLNLVTPETAIVLVFAAIMSFRFATEERQRRRTSKIFAHYVKPEIVDILVNSPDDEAALAGGRRPISVLFVDVRGFTAMSEQMEPEDVVKALDIYLEELTESVQEFDGTIDKYVGDEIMAIWNAPSYQGDHALLAVKSGLDMVSRMDKINDQLRARGLPAIRYGIGINSGDAVVGQMGSSFRKQYDVIGDTVNTGARLCSAAGGGEIIVGESTWEMIGDRLVVEETEPLRLKGKSRAFRTFRVVSIRSESEAVPVVAPATA
jgi:adenylate cyclase